MCVCVCVCVSIGSNEKDVERSLVACLLLAGSHCSLQSVRFLLLLLTPLHCVVLSGLTLGVGVS